MSKYIIDIPDGIEWGVVTCRTEDGFYTRDFDSLEELTADYINEHFGDLQDTAYQRGLNEAWECGKKLAWTAKYGGYGDRLGDVFGRDDTFDFYDYTPNEAIAKLKAYEEKQKADDKIEVGDEVKHDRGWTAVVTQVDESGLSCIDKFGAVASYSDISRFSKTDRHFDIDKILEEMRYDG